MNVRKALAALLVASLVPVLASAQTYDANQNIKNVLPSLPFAPFSLSTACGTPTTPNSCATTSFKIIPTSGAEELSLQVDAINGGTIAFYASNTNGTFYPINLSIGPSAVPGQLTVASSTTTAGRYSLNTSGTAFLAVVMTVASTSAVTVTPYLSQHGSAVSIHSSVNIPVQPAPSATFGVNANILGTVPVVLPTNAADGGASVHVANTPTPQPTNADGGTLNHISNTTLPPVPISSLPPVIIASQPPQTIASLPPVTIANAAAPYVPNSVNPLGTPAPQQLDAQGNELVTLNAPNNTGTAAPLKTTNAITGGAGSTLGLLGVGICSGATSSPYCVAVSSIGQLAVSNPYAATVNQALTTSSFQGMGCVSSGLPGSLTTGDFEPCFEDLSGNVYTTTTPAFTAGGSGSISATNGAVPIATTGYPSIAFTVSGTWTGTLSFQASSNNGATYPVTITAALATGTSTTTSITANGTYKANISPYDHFQVFGTSITSGTAVVNYSLGITPYSPTITGYGTQYATICSNNTGNCVAPGTLSQTGNSLGNSFPVQSNTLVSNGSSEDLAKSTSAFGAPSTQTGVAAVGGICNLSASINAATAATQVVALSSGKYVYVCGITLALTTTSGLGTVQWEYGTGTTCGTGTTTLSGAIPLIAGTPLVAQNPNPQFNTAVSNALCVVPGGTGVSLSGYITYGLL